MDTATKMELAKVVGVIVKEVKGVEAIYLFGSVAKGIENERSDYDVAIFVKEYPQKDVDLIVSIRLKLLGKINRLLEAIFFDLNDLEYYSPILYEIYHHGKLIFGDDVILRAEPAIRKMWPMIRNGKTIGFYVGT